MFEHINNYKFSVWESIKNPIHESVTKHLNVGDILKVAGISLKVGDSIKTNLDNNIIERFPDVQFFYEQSIY